MKELRHSSLIILRKSVLTCRKAELPSFFLSVLLTPVYHFHTLHRDLDISKVIAAESSLLRVANNRTQTRNFGFSRKVAKH